MTGRELISASLRLIGAIAPGESVAAQEANDGLSSLNRMLGAWSNDNLLIHTKVREEFTLTPSTASYTMGSGATFDTTRPIEIEEAAIEDNTASPAIEYPVNILTPEEWAAIVQKDLTSTLPTDLYASGTYPNETVTLYPVPTVAHKLVLYSSKPLTSIATLDTSVSLPPGYDEALIFNLAIRLAPEYGKAITAEVMTVAMDGKAAIKRTNTKPRYLGVDPALLRSAPYDIYRGDTR